MHAAMRDARVVDTETELNPPLESFSLADSQAEVVPIVMIKSIN
jgi:hypothetical protein